MTNRAHWPAFNAGKKCTFRSIAKFLSAVAEELNRKWNLISSIKNAHNFRSNAKTIFINNIYIIQIVRRVGAEGCPSGNIGLVWLASRNMVQSGAAGFYTGNGEKLSNSQAVCLFRVAHWELLSFSPFPVSNPATPPCIIGTVSS